MQRSALLLRWESYHWARNLWVLFIYLFFLPVMLPSAFPRLTTDSAVRVFSGVWKLLSFFKTPSWDGSPSLPLLPLFLSFIFFPTSFWRQWAAFLDAWCPLPAFRSCFVESTQRSNVLLMNLWEKVVSPSYSSAILGPPPILYFLYVLGNCINCVYCFLNFLHSNFEVLEHLCYRYSEFFFR